MLKGQLGMRHEKTYQHPVRERGGNRKRGCTKVALTVLGELRCELKGITLSLGAMVGKRDGRFLEDWPLRLDILRAEDR